MARKPGTKFSRGGPLVNADGDSSQIRTKIVGALNNTKYKVRTIKGLSAETRLPQATVVKAILTDHTLGGIVKVVPVRSKDGRVLLTTKERFMKESSFKERFIDFFASKRPEIEDAD